mmetsp:Transcript_10235/g.23333  ORF Transcript_10235/g.23333 Transcript_10235/m.23333 type:complete len:166 (-) Transcript_10235:49-546(-)
MLRTLSRSHLALRSLSTRARKFSSKPLASVPWKVGRLNHIAVAVPELEGPVKLYRDVMGAEVSQPEDLPDHGVTVVFVNLPNTKLELLLPLGANSPIAGFIKKNPSGGMHHVCLEVQDIAAALTTLKAAGVRAIDPKPKIGAHGNPVVFLHPKDCGGVLVELEQV